MGFMPDLEMITPTELADQIQPGAAEGDSDWMLLDVRTDAEWAQGRIDGSVHIPLDQLESRADEVADRVVCICAVGGRSAQAAGYLNATGRRALNLDGGVQGWAADGHTLTD